MVYGFGKDQRLLDSKDYGQVFANPAFRVSNKNFLLLALPNERPRARLGLVVSKKNAGCAVSRNRIKRLCREAFRLRQDDFATIDLVILARSGVNRLDNREITASLKQLMDELCSRHDRRPAQ